MKILFVCLGNICRSPLAEGILKHRLRENNLEAVVESAGFESYHINEHPDQRAIKTARKYGIDISDYTCRLFTTDDFDKYDVIYVMESANYRDVTYFARNDEDLRKIQFLMSVVDGKNDAVPDPYFGDEGGFDDTFQLIDKACSRIIDKIKNAESLC
jgi:protein-tyrosine phosphatase